MPLSGCLTYLLRTWIKLQLLGSSISALFERGLSRLPIETQ